MRGFVDGLHAQLDIIRQIQLEITWHDYVHGAFKGKDTTTDIRRRHLALDLSEQAHPIPKNQMALISPRVALAYGRKGDRTLNRDLTALMDMRLIRQVDTGYVAAKDVILAFQPLHRIVE